MLKNFRYSHLVKPLISFATGQGLVQALNLISVVLLLRWMPKEEYGLFTLAFSLFSMFSLFVESGINGSIIPLIGKDIHDKKIVASYIRSAKKLRLKILFFVLPIFLVTFYFYFKNQEINWFSILGSGLLILISIYFSGPASYYAVPLIIHRKIKTKYLPEVIGMLLKILLVFIAYKLELMNFLILLIIFFLTILTKYLFYRSRTKEYEEFEDLPNRRNEILRIIKPKIPSILFTAFQGQVLIMLIGFIGEKSQIADFGALSRLSQLFLFFNVFVGLFIGPFIAKSENTKLIKYTLRISLGVLIFIASTTLFSYVFPTPFYWILGEKYTNIYKYIPLFVFASSLDVFSKTLITININKNFVYYRTTLFHILFILSIDILGVYFLNLNLLISYIWFTIILALAKIFVFTLTYFYGLTKNNLLKFH